MMEVLTCSICGWAYVGDGNDAKPINDGRCCDQCHTRHVIPEAEFVPGYEFSFWTGIGAPRNTPAEIVDKLNTEINAALADPKLNARLAEWGATALPGSPADFGKLIAEETEKWGKVVKFASIKAE